VLVVVDAFEADDPNPARIQHRDQSGNLSHCEQQGAEVENNWFVGKEAWPVAAPLVQFRQPSGDGWNGGNREGHQRAATEADRSSWSNANCACQGGLTFHGRLTLDS
jgi:hypothetical protein